MKKSKPTSTLKSKPVQNFKVALPLKIIKNQGSAKPQKTGMTGQGNYK